MWLKLFGVLLVIGLIAVVGIMVARRKATNFFHPPAPAMPAVVSDAVEVLLVRFETILKDHAPKVFDSLRPGLSDADIDAIEMAHNFKLTADLRALYRWHNGSDANSKLSAFPNHTFIPLDQAAAARDTLREQVKASTWIQRQAYVSVAGHRDPWLGLIVDPAGDGYFFDPTREEAKGSFFFNFAESVSYEFFPAFRNYLAAVIEGFEAKIFVFGQYGAEIADYEKAHELWRRYGAENPR